MVQSSIQENRHGMQRDERRQIPGCLEASCQISIKFIVDAAMEVGLLIQLLLGSGSLLAREESHDCLLIHDPEPHLIDHNDLPIGKRLWFS